MSKQLVESYGKIIENIFKRSTGILGEKFINKLLLKAEKVTSAEKNSILKGIEYNRDLMQMDLVLKTYNENSSVYPKEKISRDFNKLLELIEKALTMLIGKESALKIFKDGLQDLKLNNKELFEEGSIESFLPKYML